MTQKEIILAVANQIQNMMYNDITCENGVQCFESWCENGEIFENEGMDKENAAECMKLVKRIAPLVDNLILNNLNIDNPESVNQRKIYVVKTICWREKLESIIEAAYNQTFSNEIEKINLLSFSKKNDKGEIEVIEEQFDYIHTNMTPVSVHFLYDNGKKGHFIPIKQLTEESIDKLYECVTYKY